MTKLRFLLLAPLAFVLAACIDKTEFETDPVKVRSSKGIVTCQLYTKRRLDWDEAIAHPESMTIEEANAVCIEEGKRRAGL